MAEIKKAGDRRDEEKRDLRRRDEAEEPVSTKEREREFRPPARSDEPEPSKLPGLDGDVFGR